MEPLTAAIARASASELLAEVKIAQDLRETATEAAETLVGEQGLLQQLDTLRFDPIDSLAARNEATLSEVRREVLATNREAGLVREEVVSGELLREYPGEAGYSIESQSYLRDENRGIVRDPETGESRKIDFAVIKDGEIVRSVEVTSETADKAAQVAKEERIRDAGGDYILDRRTDELVRFAPDVKTEVVRRV